MTWCQASALRKCRPEAAVQQAGDCKCTMKVSDPDYNREAAAELARRGASVTLACRNIAAAEDAAREIRWVRP